MKKGERTARTRVKRAATIKAIKHQLLHFDKTLPNEPDVEPAEMHERQQPTERNQIRNWRLYRGIKMQKELADMTIEYDRKGLGLDRVTICRLETGTMQYNETHIRLLSFALRVAPRDLLGTNPFDSGDIFKQYADLPERDRPNARLNLKR